MSKRKEKLNHLFIQKVNKIIAANYQEEAFRLPELCEHLCMSRTQVYRKIHEITGDAPSNLIKKYRLDAAKTLLMTTDKRISEIVYEVGFSDPNHFTKIFKIHFGYLPSEVE